MPFETQFVIRSTYIFGVSMVIFATAAFHVVSEYLRGRRGGEDGWQAATRGFRDYRVGVALVFGFILLTRSQLP